MSTPYNNEERRFALRMSLRLPIVISGRAEDGSAWSEPTETDDISTSGALFHLNQKVNRGERLYLRAHRPDGTPIEATALVVRVAPAIYGTARVGVQIAEPTENWLRLFVSWVADEQPAVTNDPAWSEPTETDDISTSGALFHLNQKVNRGERLYLRAHRPDGTPIEATALVVRVAPAIYGTARVGVQIAEPTENWLRL